MADTGAFDLFGAQAYPSNSAGGTIFDYRSPTAPVNPFALALLNAGANMMRAAGPSPYPISTASGLGAGVQGGVQGLMQGQQLAAMNQLKEQELQKARRQAAIENLALSRLFPENPFAPAPVPTAPISSVPVLGPSGALSRPSVVITNPAANEPFGVPVSGPNRVQQPAAVGPAPALATPIGVDQTTALLALAGAGNPGLMKLAEFSQQANSPTPKQREALALGYRPGTPEYNAYVGTQYNQGVAWQVGSDGKLHLASGYAEGMGATREAEEAAKAQYDLVEVPAPGGGSRLMPRAEAVRLLGGGAAPVNAPSQPGQVGYGYRPPQAQQAANTRFSETLSGEFAKTYADLQRADFNAPATLAKYQRLGNLLGGVKTGKFTTTTTAIKAAAKSVGIDLGALGVTDDVAPAQAAIALSNQLALELRNPAGGAGMPGALSDKDREFLVSMIPGLENDPGAIPLMIEYRTKLAQREQQVAKMARAYKKRTGTFDDGFYDELARWSAKNPLFTAADRAKLPGGGFKLLGVER